AVEAKPTPFAHCYQVVDFFPFQLKRLRHYLHKNEIGDVIIKKRGSPLDPDKLQQQLRLKGPKENKCILFLTHIQGEAVVVIGQKLFYLELLKYDRNTSRNLRISSGLAK